MSEANKHEEAIKKAKAEGFEIIYGDETHLLLDLDEAKNRLQLKPRLEKLLELHPDLEPEELKRWRSKSGNLHVVVRINKGPSLTERILLEVCLGSDPVRGMWNLRRMQEGEVMPSVLFKPPANYKAPKEGKTK